MQTEIDVPNKDLSLTPGMYANTELSLQHKEGILTVPVEAVVRDGDKQAVLVVDSNNEVRQRTIQTGLQGSELIEVTGGLQEGERVIDGGQSKFQVGEKVQPHENQESAVDVKRDSSNASDGGQQ
jgi:hypothetical protein